MDLVPITVARGHRFLLSGKIIREMLKGFYITDNEQYLLSEYILTLESSNQFGERKFSNSGKLMRVCSNSKKNISSEIYLVFVTFDGIKRKKTKQSWPQFHNKHSLECFTEPGL